MSDATGNDPDQGELIDSRTSIGTQLRAARTMRKLGIEQVAQDLHLDTAIVEALENDRHDMLPAPIFVQGYLKSYARLLGLPMDGLIRDYSEQVGEPPPLTVIRTNIRLPAVVRPRSIKVIRNVIILLLAAILLWLAWPFAERYIDSQRESATELPPGRLELPPAGESSGDGF